MSVAQAQGPPIQAHSAMAMHWWKGENGEKVRKMKMCPKQTYGNK